MVKGGGAVTGKQSIFALASVYVGTVIGAGFASGQEILQFFGKYGYKGIPGIIVITILFSLLGASVLNTVYMKKYAVLESLHTLFWQAFCCYKHSINIFIIYQLCCYALREGAVIYEISKFPMYMGFYNGGNNFYVFVFGIKGLQSQQYSSPIPYIGNIMDRYKCYM